MREAVTLCVTAFLFFSGLTPRAGRRRSDSECTARSWPRPEPTIVLERTPAGLSQVARAGEYGLALGIASDPSIRHSNPSLGSKLQEEEDRRLERLTSLRPRLGWTENGGACFQAQQQVVLSLGHVC
jgi:hypothetical protein